ncbi:MAG TPA: ribonuclease HII [Candidatus Paceibacterota bacterium]|nr:ribonuclease HII [Candidatus Paceibacterota bacterium]
MQFPDYKSEQKALQEGYCFVAGCDEVGVGPIAGPVVAAACILDPSTIGKYRSPNKWYYRVRDSKTTNETERESLVKEILDNTIAYGIGVVWQEEIDQINIHHAGRKAMRLAVNEMLGKIKDTKQRVKKNNGAELGVFLFVDGRFEVSECADLVKQKCVIKGDQKVLSISAASIIAKVHRDNIMKEFNAKFPSYGFAKHKGYNTKMHQDALKKMGLTSLHRRSFFKNSKLLANEKRKV